MPIDDWEYRYLSHGHRKVRRGWKNLGHMELGQLEVVRFCTCLGESTLGWIETREIAEPSTPKTQIKKRASSGISPQPSLQDTPKGTASLRIRNRVPTFSNNHIFAYLPI